MITPFNSKNAFLTLATGNFYTFRVRSFLECVCKLTDSDAVVVTDCVEDVNEYISMRLDNYKHRIHVVNLNSITDHGVKDGAGKFNYNLKGVSICWLLNMDAYETLTYCDSDVVMLGWDYKTYQEFWETVPDGFYARLRNTPAQEPHLHFLLTDKVFRLGKQITDFKARMPIECVMFFKGSASYFSKFTQEWMEMINDVHRMGLDSFMEALEMTYAMTNGDIQYHEINEEYATRKFLSNFRVLHHDKLIEVF
jgi:hypothetical protein